MKVLLLDLDINKRRRPFPNLALMKLSAYHKARGDENKFKRITQAYEIILKGHGKKAEDNPNR